jgi:hypothetical protein
MVLQTRRSGIAPAPGPAGRPRGHTLANFMKRYNADNGSERGGDASGASLSLSQDNGNNGLTAELRGRTTTRLARATEPALPRGSFEEAVATLNSVVNLCVCASFTSNLPDEKSAVPPNAQSKTHADHVAFLDSVNAPM